MLSGLSVRRYISGQPDVVTVSADSFTAFNVGGNAIAAMIWNPDGTREEKQNADADVRVFASTDWLIPNTSAPGPHRIRHSSESGDTGAPWSPAGALNTYLALTSAAIYEVTDDTTTATTRSVTFNIQIDDGAGNVQDQASMTLTADREDF